MAKVLMKGAEALAQAAISGGCRYFFGYPITPQNEVPEYMAAHLPEVGGVYVQGESEVASINMVLGAASTGAQIMTSSSSPGISLMSEGLSYIAANEYPCVVMNVVRGGPGLGGILPSQCDYGQATRGGGNGDYHLFVLAPSNLQEAVDLIQRSWDYAFKYMNPVMILADGFMGQMMEPVEIRERAAERGDWKKWAVGCFKERGNKRTLFHSLYLAAGPLEEHNKELQKKYELMKQDAMAEDYMVDDAEVIITAFGTTARIAKTAIMHLRAEGKKVGLIRPITVYPFPADHFKNLPATVRHILDVEMNCGQMIDDVKLATECRYPVTFYGRCGGFAPSVEEVEDACRKLFA